MNSLIGVAVCLCVAFVGTDAIKCFSYQNETCSDSTGCGPIPSVVTDCPDSTLCSSESISFHLQADPSVTSSIREGDCLYVIGHETRCYTLEGKESLEELEIPSLEQEVTDMEESLGMKFTGFTMCVCSTDLCNGVGASSVSISVLNALFLVTLSSVLSN